MAASGDSWGRDREPGALTQGMRDPKLCAGCAIKRYRLPIKKPFPGGFQAGRCLHGALTAIKEASVTSTLGPGAMGDGGGRNQEGIDALCHVDVLWRAAGMALKCKGGCSPARVLTLQRTTGPQRDPVGMGSSEGTWLRCLQAEAGLMWGQKEPASPNPGQRANGTGKVLWETSQPVSEPGYLIPREDLVSAWKTSASIPGSRSISPSSLGERGQPARPRWHFVTFPQPCGWGRIDHHRPAGSGLPAAPCGAASRSGARPPVGRGPGAGSRAGNRGMQSGHKSREF